MILTYFPNFIYGKDALAKLTDLVRNHRRALIIGGKTALEKTKSKIDMALKDSDALDYKFICYGGECSYKNIETVRDTIKTGGFDIVIGVGGGKALDTSKAAADMAEVEIITLPTVASTCAATTALSVVYDDNGNFLEAYYLKRNPPNVIIDTEVIANSPWRYLRGGIGDTIAKYYELQVNQRGQVLQYNDMLGKKISSLCIEPLLSYGAKAIKDIKNQQISFELEQVILNIIISNGYASFLVDQKYNGSSAHGVFYGFTLSKIIEKKYLHGEIVAYGLLVLLQMEKNEVEFKKLYSFYKVIGLPTCLKDLELSIEDEDMDAILEKAVESPDMNKMPYKVSVAMLKRVMSEVEIYYPTL